MQALQHQGPPAVSPTRSTFCLRCRNLKAAPRPEPSGRRSIEFHKKHLFVDVVIGIDAAVGGVAGMILRAVSAAEVVESFRSQISV